MEHFKDNCQCDCCPYDMDYWDCSVPDAVQKFGFTAHVFATNFNMWYACMVHDFCYLTTGRSQKECDNEFHHNMLRVCDAPDGLDIITLGLLSCRAIARYAYNGVRGVNQTLEARRRKRNSNCYSSWEKCDCM